MCWGFAEAQPPGTQITYLFLSSFLNIVDAAPLLNFVGKLLLD